MARFTRWRIGAVVVATGVLVAACSGGGGGSSSNDSTAIGAPTGISGTSSSAHGSKSASKGAKASGSRTSSHGASTTAAHSSTSTHHGGGGHSSSTPAQHSSSTHADSGCRSSAPPAPSDPSKASITLCPAIGLHTGDTVTITGHSFKPNESLIATECHYLGENANNYGLSQCDIGNILNFKPAKTTKSDASGNVSVTLVVAEQFKRIDCSSEQCLVSVAVPIQNGADDNPHVLIYFS